MGTALRTIRPLSDPIVRYYLCHRRHLGHLLRQGDCDTSAQALRRAEGRIRPAHNAEAPNEPRFCERNAATVKRFQNTVLLHRLQDLTIRACVHRATRELDVVRPPIPDRRGRVPKPEVPHSIGDCYLLACHVSYLWARRCSQYQTVVRFANCARGCLSERSSVIW